MRPIVGDLGTHQLLGDHADHLAIGGKRGVGDHAHQADVSTAVHQPDATVGKRRPKLLCRLTERRRCARIRPAVHADARGWF